MDRESSSLLDETNKKTTYVYNMGNFAIENTSQQNQKQSWTQTPQLRAMWTSNEANSVKINDIMPLKQASFASLPSPNGTLCILRTPGLIIAVVINLLQSISYGLAFFPSSWNFPVDVPRTIGCQMFLFSTMISQVVLTSMSEFPTAQGMQMVENIPFMHTICNIAIKYQGPGKETFSTVIVAFGLSSIIVGIFFFLLGYLKLGNSVYFFPRHVIIGCVGGIGIFLFTTSIEVSTDVPWEWSYKNIQNYFYFDIIILWIAAVILEIILQILLKVTKLSFLPPFYFVCIPIIVYSVLYSFKIPLNVAHEKNWFFEAEKAANFTLMWDLINFNDVHWYAIGQMMPTFVSLSVFSLMHVPINIPSLSMSTGKDVEMNRELIAHGYSNAIAGLFGGLQNYICYSNSLLYFKCNGGGMISGYLLAAITTALISYGPTLVYYVPRCMAGCILLHIGTELTKEALLDSYHSFDKFEYGSVLLIMVSMTAYGMTIGLAVGVFCAAVTFTLQASKQVKPIREMLRATSLRSSQWRPLLDVQVLQDNTSHILVIELQGQIFFGNATAICSEVKKVLELANGDIWYVLIDFTLVLAIDSSAADSLLKMHAICKKYGAKLCYSRGSRKGFPCIAPLSERLFKLEKETEEEKVLSSDKSHMIHHTLHITDSLDEGLQWCEDDIIATVKPTPQQFTLAFLQTAVVGSPKSVTKSASQRLRPDYVVLLQAICPGESPDVIRRLAHYFKEEVLPSGIELWKQGSVSDKLLLLGRGSLISHVEGEYEKTKEEILVGFLLGEYGLLTGASRRSTVIVHEESYVFVLTKIRFEEMLKEDPHLAWLLSRVCMGYLEHRVQHVANRMWGSHTVPI